MTTPGRTSTVPTTADTTPAPTASGESSPAAPAPTAPQPGRPAITYGTRVTERHRDRMTRRVIDVLAPITPPSQAHLNPRVRYANMAGPALDWIGAHPGASYQDKWVSSGADTDVTAWGWDEFSTVNIRARFFTIMDALIVLGALRPSYAWLLAGRHKRLWKLWVANHDRSLFARLEQAGNVEGIPALRQRGTIVDLIRICIRTGKPLAALTTQNLLDYRAAVIAQRGSGTSVSWFTTYHTARSIGLFADGPPEFKSLLTDVQRSPSEIVEHYRIASPSMRQLLTEYLAEHRPNLDYGSFVHMAHHLCKLFWLDLEEHHPGLDTHRLTRDQTEAWKERLAVLPDGKPRRRVSAVLLAVRTFYLDINHWAHDAPEQWAHWAAQSPITRQDVRAISRVRRAETARMHARVREFSPHLPRLARTSREHRDLTVAVLAAAKQAQAGDTFDIGKFQFTRITVATAGGLIMIRDQSGASHDAVFAEHEAFWSWAMIEVLRHTGIRIEELLELTHHSIRPYRQPGGEIIPLLQIAPSKTDTERVIPASPALATALARIVARVAGEDGKIALTSRRDEHELIWSEPMPHLFAHRPGGRPRAFAGTTLREYLTRATKRTGLPDTRLTPHDFRRLFSTEAVNGGLPIHIAAQLLGHRNLNTTMEYTAIYPQEVFDRYQEFLSRRRATRPAEDYRAPTAAELAEFAEHFGNRRIELGACVRPYNTPCIHEHACLRCPFQQVDAENLPQLQQVEADIHPNRNCPREILAR